MINRMIRLIAALIFFMTCVGGCATSAVASSVLDRSTTEYDVYFKKYSKRYFGVNYDWKVFKAQSLAESRLDPNAVSPVGAEGMMQIMPATCNEIVTNVSYLQSCKEPKWNIAAGIYYDKRLHKQWRSKRKEPDRQGLMFASYNAGLKYPVEAQKVCYAKEPPGRTVNTIPFCNTWEGISKYAPEITKWKSEETIPYVDRIFRYQGKIPP